MQEVMPFNTSNYNYRRIKHPCVLLQAESVPQYSFGVVHREDLQVEVEVGVREVCLFIKIRTGKQCFLIVKCYCSPNLKDSLSKVRAAIRQEKHQGPIMELGDMNASFRGEFGRLTNRNGLLVDKICEDLRLLINRCKTPPLQGTPR